MEYKDFEKIFKDADFTERQIKKVRAEAYKEFEDMSSKRSSTSGQKKAAYGFLVTTLYNLTQKELASLMWKICKATADQSGKLYQILDSY